MRKILITGINGFTGFYLAEAFREKGYQVDGLAQFVNRPGDGIYSCDLLDKQKLSTLIGQLKPDLVAHLAGTTYVGHHNPEEFYRVNVIGTTNLLEALTQPGLTPPRVLVASSANIYGTPDLETLSESVPPAPVNHYAASKVAMEHMVRTWFDKLPIIITRPFNYTGVGQEDKFLIPKIIGHFKRKEKIIELGNLDISRDFSDVRDVAEAYVRLLESDVRSVTVNICSGFDISLKKIIEDANLIAGYDIEVRVNPEFVRANEIKRLHGDNNYLTQLIGNYARIPFKDTLRWMLDVPNLAND